MLGMESRSSELRTGKLELKLKICYKACKIFVFMRLIRIEKRPNHPKLI